MKILKIDKQLNQLLVIPENLDDLWHLEKVIEKNDIVAGKTDRKINDSIADISVVMAGAVNIAESIEELKEELRKLI